MNSRGTRGCRPVHKTRAERSLASGVQQVQGKMNSIEKIVRERKMKSQCVLVFQMGRLNLFGAKSEKREKQIEEVQ